MRVPYRQASAEFNAKRRIADLQRRIAQLQAQLKVAVSDLDRLRLRRRHRGPGVPRKGVRASRPL